MVIFFSSSTTVAILTLLVVLNTQEKKGLVVKFLKASDWNTKLAEYGVKFDQRRSELQFSLQMQTMTVVQENNDM